ncbi:MAG: SAM-dependent chlorinase/fluorinase [Candidatus Zixiibacteriota bacterium]
MSTIALLTDFGDNDGFVGMIKGTIKRFAPDCEIIDITHNISSFDIRAAAFVLQKSVRYYPAGTVFLGVVDPGVGSARRMLAATAGGYYFVAPDNGLLSYLLTDFPQKQVYAIENEELFLPEHGQTFHGRDIMAPVAARLAAGLPLESVGPKVETYAYLKIPNLLKHGRSVIGEIVYVDKFGNLISNIAKNDLPRGVELTHLRCTVGDVKNVAFVNSYSEGRDLSAIISGYDTVEIFVNQGSAASKFSRVVGTTIVVEG